MKSARGFTLIELLVTLSIIAILSTIAILIFTDLQKKSRDSRRTQDIRSIQTALEIYYEKNSDYPLESTDLVPLYMHALPKDPKTNQDYVYIDQDQCYQLAAGLENPAVRFVVTCPD